MPDTILNTPSRADLIRRIDQLKVEQKQAEEDHLKARKERAVAMQGLEHQLYVLGMGLDPDRFAAGRALFQINDGREALLGPLARDAMSDLASEAPRLLREYFGCKDYDRWSGQREDHEYGMGPRHGYIVASIGLTREARQNPDKLKAHLEDALYFLSAVAAGTHPRLAPHHLPSQSR